MKYFESSSYGHIRNIGPQTRVSGRTLDPGPQTFGQELVLKTLGQDPKSWTLCSDPGPLGRIPGPRPKGKTYEELLPPVHQECIVKLPLQALFALKVIGSIF